MDFCAQLFDSSHVLLQSKGMLCESILMCVQSLYDIVCAGVMALAGLAIKFSIYVSTQVSLLVRLLGSLFPRTKTSHDTTDEHVQWLLSTPGPYHKSVLDWLTCTNDMDSGQFQVNQRAGHACLSRASHSWLEEHTPQPWQVARAQLEAPLQAASADQQLVSSTYALRHAVAHACQANDALLLETILHHLGLWEATFTAGIKAKINQHAMLCNSSPRPGKHVMQWRGHVSNVDVYAACVPAASALKQSWHDLQSDDRWIVW